MAVSLYLRTLMPALASWKRPTGRRKRPGFPGRAARLLQDLRWPPDAPDLAGNLSAYLGGARIYLKREDLAHSGAHKINNALGQALLAQRMGKRRSLPKRAPGSTAWPPPPWRPCWDWNAWSIWARVDIARQQPNVLRMRLLGAEVRPVESGSRTLKDAVNEAIRDWVTNVAIPTTCWARRSDRTPTRPWCATSRR
jgi:tryptophan synthase beta chain